jgi:hypothetical protein
MAPMPASQTCCTFSITFAGASAVLARALRAVASTLRVFLRAAMDAPSRPVPRLDVATIVAESADFAALCQSEG